MLTHFRPRIRSRHPSHDVLRNKTTFPLFPFKSVIRLGSTKEFNDDRIEVNTIEAIKNSSSKLLMKTCFSDNNVKTANWWSFRESQLDSGFVKEDGVKDNTLVSIENLSYPIISKSYFGSRNQGNTKHNNRQELESWLEDKNTNNYIFEKYYNYNREYRLHITGEGCFYTCRKMLKEDTPQEDRWFRNDAHCVWILEDNELFDKPVNWDEVVKESVKALKAVGLDIGAVDLRIQSAKDNNEEIRNNPEFIIVEINSAPSFGAVTEDKYIKELTKVLINKQNER